MPNRSPVLGVDPTKTYAADEFGIGTRAHLDSAVYIFSLAGGALVAKDPAKLVGLGTFVVTASGNAGVIDGVAPVAVASGQYFWLQVQGYVADVIMATTVADADPLSYVADASGDFTTATIGTHHVRAKALEADTAGIGDIYLFAHL